MKYQTKQERKAIYEKLLSEVNIPINGDYFICWKLYEIINGVGSMSRVKTFEQDESLSHFPEFALALKKYLRDGHEALEEQFRVPCLQYAIELCGEAESVEYKTKEDRKLIYEKLLTEVDIPVGRVDCMDYFTCWKLYIAKFGHDEFIRHMESEEEFNSNEMKLAFPEFAIAMESIGGHCVALEHEDRPKALQYAIDLCDTIENRRLRFLDDTVAHFNINNRAENNNKCVYSPIEGQSDGCAIGRHIKDKEVCRMLDGLGFIGSGVSVKNTIVFYHLPQQLKELGVEFLASVQCLHDFIERWDVNGLNEQGKVYYKGIVDNYCTPKN